MARKFLAGAGLVRALENEENPSVPVEGAEAPPAAESAETELLDVAESAEEGAAEEAATEEAVEAVEALESYVTALEAAAENGGLDRHGARVLNIGLESIYTKLGFSNPKAAVSMESFGGSTSKAGATTLALEDVKEKIKEIWKSIVAAIKRAIAWVKGHFDKMFGAAQNLQKRAKALQEKSKGVTGTQKEKSFENERIVKALAKNGTVSANVSTDLEHVKKVAEQVFTTISDFNGKRADEILEKLNASVEATDAAANAAISGYQFGVQVPAQTSVVSDPKAAGFGEPGTGMTLYRSAELPGNKALLAEVPATALTGEAAFAAEAKFTSYLGAFNPKGKEPSKTSVNTLQPSECGKIGAEVEEMMQDVINYKAKLNKMTDLQDKLAKAAEKAGKDSTTEENKALSKLYSMQQKATTNVVSNLGRAPSAFAAYSLNVSKAALDYAELSLKQYAAK